MEDLKILADVLNRNKVKHIEVIDQHHRSDSKVMELYYGLSNQQFESEEAAMAYFYGDSPNKNANFNRLKRKLRERLLNTLFFIDVNQPQYKDIQKAYYLCYKDIAAIKVLVGKNAKKPAMTLAEKTLKKAIHFEFIDIVLALARELRIYYGSILGDPKKFKIYNELVKQYTGIGQAEMEIESYYGEMMVQLINSRTIDAKLIEISRPYAERIEEIITQYHSYRINLIGYQMLALRYEIVNDFENTLRICQNALTYFRKKSHIASNTVLLVYNIKMLNTYLRLKRYEEAGNQVDTCLELATPGTMNWFRVLDQKMILCFHTQQLQEAFHTYLLAVQHPNFTQQIPDLQEHWRIHEAFVHYFLAIGKVETTSEYKVPDFKPGRFLNQVPNVTKDKRGTNTSVLILQFLFLLHRRKYADIIERMEPLKTYNHRYLRKDEHFRSNCFFKMLLQLPAASFHKQGVLRKSKKYWEKLKLVPLGVENQSVEIEIVPYEMLWEFILESLDNKFH
jgi:hypothetical protein